MGIKERKERERDEHRERILEAAGDIIGGEGIEKLSIRKIAQRIEYSPALIYHYFRDKDDIVNQLMKNGYQQIVTALALVQTSTDEPRQKLKELIGRYIEIALQIPDEYLAILLNKSPAVLEHTSVLFEGAAGKRQALEILCQCLKELNKDRNLDDSQIELTAQIIWTATFGLIARLIIEKEIGEEQRKKLIEQHILLVTERMITGK